MYYKCNWMQSYNMLALVLQTRVINYDSEWASSRPASMASSRDGEWDILDTKASRIMALQLALNLPTLLIDPSPAEQTAALDVTLSPSPWPSWLLQGPRQIL